MIQASNTQLEITNGRVKLSIWLTPEIIDAVQEIKKKSNTPDLTSNEINNLETKKKLLFDKIFSTGAR